jgi:predicted Zn finger-like uncharacterized protein
MLIVCPSCASEYIIDPAQIGADGRMVRCGACRGTFFVAGEPEVTEEELAETEEFNIYLDTQAWPEPDPALAVEATSERTLPGDDTASAAAAKRAWRPGFGLGPFGAGFRAAPSGLAMAALVLAVAVGLLAGRESVARTVPSAARLYAAIGLPVNPTGLELKAVRSELVVDGADKLLVVEGEILNVATRDVGVPALELSVRGPDGLSLYTWTNEAPRKTLAAAESARFKARLASPPSEGREVLVRFAQAPGGSTVSARAR